MAVLASIGVLSHGACGDSGAALPEGTEPVFRDSAGIVIVENLLLVALLAPGCDRSVQEDACGFTMLGRYPIGGFLQQDP